MIGAIASIALGGAFGALARHGVNVAAAKTLDPGFPYGTIIVNIAGSFLMGLIIAGLAHMNQQPSQEVRLFIITGFLGAFTTFSTFSLDFATLFERQDYLSAGLYLIFSVTLSIGALFAALILIRSLSA